MFPKWLIDKSGNGYLSKVRTTGKALPNVKHQTATFISYLISVIVLPTLEEKFHLLLISIAKT